MNFSDFIPSESRRTVGQLEWYKAERREKLPDLSARTTPPAFLEVFQCRTLSRLSMDSTSKRPNISEEPITIRNLFPNLSDEELKKAEENLHRYFEFAVRICSAEVKTPRPLDCSVRSSTLKERSTSLKKQIVEHG